MGVDITKPLEAPSLGLGSNKNYEEFFAWYVVFGDCDIDYSVKVDKLTVMRQISHPPVKVDEDFFVVEVIGMVFN
jgi:hypothetical protein